MKINKPLTLAIVASAFTLAQVPHGHASPYQSNVAGPMVKLDQCQKRFGTDGDKSHVFGYLPLKGDYFYGSVTIGSPETTGEYTVETPFKDGSFHYHQAIPYKNLELTLNTDPAQVPPSECSDYENANGQAIEVVQFDWKGDDRILASTSWFLWYRSFGVFDCYLGADNGEANIVLMCKLPDFLTIEQLASDSNQLYDQIRLLASNPGFVTEVCDYLGEKAIKGKPELCRQNIEDIQQGLYPVFTNVTKY